MIKLEINKTGDTTNVTNFRTRPGDESSIPQHKKFVPKLKDLLSKGVTVKLCTINKSHPKWMYSF